MNAHEYNGFKAGERVRFIGGTRKYNNHVTIQIGSIGVVHECPGEDWPADCVQLSIDGGIGAVDIRCLERLNIPPIRHNQTLVDWAMRHYKFRVEQFDEHDQKRLMFGDIDRAGGTVQCQHCGRLYSEHPGIADTGLVSFENIVVTCDWRIYKL